MASLPPGTLAPDDPNNPFNTGASNSADTGVLAPDDPNNPFNTGYAPQKDLSIGSALEQGAENYLPSLGKNVANMASAVRHPITTAENLGRLGEGEYNVLTGNEQGSHVDMAHAINQFYKDRYGSWDGFKQAVANDPFGVTMDLGMLMAGPEAAIARTGTTGAKLAELSKVATNPVLYGGAKAAGAIAPKLGNYLAESAGVLSGTGGDAYKIAANSVSDPVKNVAFKNARSGVTDSADIVDKGRDAVKQVKGKLSAEYRNGMDDVAQNHDIPISDFDETMQDAFDQMDSEVGGKGSRSGLPQNNAANQALQAMKDVWLRWKEGLRQQGHYGYTVTSADELKQMMQNEVSSLAENDQAGWVANRLTGTVRDMIRRESPDYADVMDKYDTTKTMLDELESTLSLKKGATVDTAIRKLQSSLRDQVNTGFGQRRQLLDYLDEVSPGLKEAIAGMTLKSPMPRGVARLGPIGALMGMPFGIHSAGLGYALGTSGELLMSSPKFGSYIARGLGRTSPYAGNISRGAATASPFAVGVTRTSSTSPFESQ